MGRSHDLGGGEDVRAALVTFRPPGRPHPPGAGSPVWCAASPTDAPGGHLPRRETDEKNLLTPTRPRGYYARVLPISTIRERAAQAMTGLTGAAYLRVWRARRALGMPTRRTADAPSQAAMLARRTGKRNRKR